MPRTAKLTAILPVLVLERVMVPGAGLEPASMIGIIAEIDRIGATFWILPIRLQMPR